MGEGLIATGAPPRGRDGSPWKQPTPATAFSFSSTTALNRRLTCRPCVRPFLIIQSFISSSLDLPFPPLPPYGALTLAPLVSEEPVPVRRRGSPRLPNKAQSSLTWRCKSGPKTLPSPGRGWGASLVMGGGEGHVVLYPSAGVMAVITGRPPVMDTLYYSPYCSRSCYRLYCHLQRPLLPSPPLPLPLCLLLREETLFIQLSSAIVILFIA